MSSSKPISLGLVFPGCHKRGGVERIVWEAARWFSEHGHDVTVIAEKADTAGLPGVTFRQVERRRGPGFLSPIQFGRAAQHVLASNRPGLVISFGVTSIQADVQWVSSVHRAWLDAAVHMEREAPPWRNPRIRYVIPRHRTLLQQERRYFTDPARLVITCADQVGRDLTRLYDVPPGRLLTINNGFDPEELSPGRARALRMPARASFGFAEGDVVALMVANELPRKGFGIALEALGLIPNPHLHLLLLGHASPEGYWDRIRALGLQDRVHYGGSFTDIAVGYGAADLLVLPTKYEAFCLAVVESLASGVPVITTAVAGAGDLVEDGVNGRLLADPNDSTGLARLLSEAIDTEQRDQWAAHAAASVRSLTWDGLFRKAETALLAL